MNKSRKIVFFIITNLFAIFLCSSNEFSLNDKVTHTLLIFLCNLLLFWDSIRLFIQGDQYKIDSDIKRIKKMFKKASLKCLVNSIRNYYESNEFKTEEYLSRYYKLQNKINAGENIKYGLVSGFILYGATELIKGFYDEKIVNDTMVNIWNFKQCIEFVVVSVIMIIIIIISLLTIITILNFGYFKPSKKRALEAIINEEELQIVKNKIEELKK